MNLQWPVVGLFLALAFAGCTDNGADTDSMDSDAMPEEAIDCTEWLAMHDGMTQEEFDAMPAEHRDVECAEDWVPYIGPLTEVTYHGCYYAGVQNLLPESAWGSPPDGFEFVYSNGQIVIISILLECEDLEYRNGTVDGVQGVFHWLIVEPPSEWADSDMGHNYFIGGMIGSEDQFDVFTEFGATYADVGRVDTNIRRQTSSEWMGQFGYNGDGFNFIAEVQAGAEPSESEGTARYYWHTGDELRVFENHISTHTQYIGGGQVVPMPFVDPLPGVIPGIGFYGIGNDQPLDLSLTRVDLLDPSA